MLMSSWQDVGLLDYDERHLPMWRCYCLTLVIEQNGMFQQNSAMFRLLASSSAYLSEFQDETTQYFVQAYMTLDQIWSDSTNTEKFEILLANSPCLDPGEYWHLIDVKEEILHRSLIRAKFC